MLEQSVQRPMERDQVCVALPVFHAKDQGSIQGAGARGTQKLADGEFLAGQPELRGDPQRDFGVTNVSRKAS